MSGEPGGRSVGDDDVVRDVPKISGFTATQVNSLAQMFVAYRSLPVPSAPLPATDSPVADAESYRIFWEGLRELELERSYKMEEWFSMFENRMNVVGVPRKLWSAKFLECPSVSDSVKSSINVLPLTTYDEIRDQLLSDYGPVFPLSYFMYRLYCVQGTSGAEVRKQLLHAMSLYNRVAARADPPRPLLTQSDLCYPFAYAFPKEVKANLLTKFQLCLLYSNPFDHLVAEAPP